MVIACVNDNYERIFNQRGQSGDRIVTKHILQKSSNRRLCTLRWRRSTARRRSWPNIDQFRQLIRDRVQNISICDVAAIPFTSTPLIILRQPARKVSHTVLSGIPATRPTALPITKNATTIPSVAQFQTEMPTVNRRNPTINATTLIFSQRVMA